MASARLQREAGWRTWAARWETFAMGAITLAASLLRLDRLGTRNLGPDEAYSLDLARKTFAELLAYLQANDAHPVGYYALLSAWIRAFGDNLAVMRGLSAIFGMIAVILVWRLGRHLFSPSIGVIAAALVALNPFQIFASNELRMYMPLECLALTSTWILWRGRTAPGHGWWIAYGVSLALMLYLSYYSSLLIVAHAIWLVVSGGARTHGLRYGLGGLIALILYAPWMPYLAYTASVLRHNAFGWRGAGIWPTYIPEVIASQTFGGYVFHMVTYHSSKGIALWDSAMLLVPVVILIAVGVAAQGRINREARRLVALCWIVPIALVVVASVRFGKVAAYTYHLTFLQPFLALALAAGIVHFRDVVVALPRVLVSAAAAVAVLVFVAPALTNMQWNPAYQYYRYDQAARLVKDLYRPTDVVVLLPRATRRGFHFYFDPPGKELGVPIDPERWTVESLRPGIREAAEALGPADARVWLVYSPPVPEGGFEELLAAIEKRGYRRAISHDFRGLSVDLLVRPAR